MTRLSADLGSIRATSAAMLVATTCATILTMACGDPARPTWDGAIEERSGVLWTVNPPANRAAEDAEPPFALELEQTFGAEEAPDEALLTFITDTAVDSAGNVYLIDDFERLVAFGRDGSLRWVNDRRGEGPGAIENSTWLAWNGADLLYVDDGNGTLVDVWRTSGEYLDGRRLPTVDVSFGWIAGMPDADTLVLWSYPRTQGDGAVVHVIEVGADWQRASEPFFAAGGRLADGDEEAMWGRAVIRVVGDTIWVGNVLRYELRAYGLDGNLRRVIARDQASLPEPFLYRGSGFILGAFEPPLWLDTGYGLVPRYWVQGDTEAEAFKRAWDRFLTDRDPAKNPMREFASAIDLIDSEGRILGTISYDGVFDAIGEPELIGPDGRLYTRVSDPYPHVRRYRVVVAESASSR